MATRVVRIRVYNYLLQKRRPWRGWARSANRRRCKREKGRRVDLPYELDASSSSSSSRAMGSAPVGVRCQFHQLPPTSSVRRHLAQFLKRHTAPLDDVVYPFPVWSSPLVCVLHSSRHQLLYLPVIMHSANMSKQS